MLHPFFPPIDLKMQLLVGKFLVFMIVKMFHDKLLILNGKRNFINFDLILFFLNVQYWDFIIYVNTFFLFSTFKKYYGLINFKVIFVYKLFPV